MGLANRPAETGAGLAGAVVALVVYFFHIKDPSVIAPMVVVVGAIPAAITRIVTLLERR